MIYIVKNLLNNFLYKFIQLKYLYINIIFLLYFKIYWGILEKFIYLTIKLFK